jgi:hypothetical protein
MNSHILVLTPLLMKLDIAVFNAPTGSMIITSDHPCVWFDSAAYKRPPLYSSPALKYKTIEITLPISPNQIVWLNRMNVTGYHRATSAMVDELNRRTRFHADKYFVVNRNELNPLWLDPGIEPDDSWEKMHDSCLQEDDISHGGN